MRYFLLTFGQQAGRILTLDEFSEDAVEAALEKRFELEEAHRDETDIEVVLLGAPSLEQLKVTHSRYFMSPNEILIAG